MNNNEILLLEAISNMFSDKTNLGLSEYTQSDEYKNWDGPRPHYYPDYVENIFRLKINNPKFSHYESISGAFYHTHSYKNIFDDTFPRSFDKQMENMIVPCEERKAALNVVNDIRNDICNRYKEIAQGKDVTNKNIQDTQGPDVDMGIVNMNDMREVTNPS